MADDAKLLAEFTASDLDGRAEIILDNFEYFTEYIRLRIPIPPHVAYAFILIHAALLQLGRVTAVNALKFCLIFGEKVRDIIFSDRPDFKLVDDWLRQTVSKKHYDFLVSGKDENPITFARCITMMKTLSSCYLSTRNLNKPMILHEVIKLKHIKDPQLVRPKTMIVYSIETTPPFEYDVMLGDLPIGHSSEGKFVFTTAGGYFNESGIELHSSANKGDHKVNVLDKVVSDCGMRLYDFSIQFTDDICDRDNYDNIELLISYYNIWLEKTKQPFGKIGMWAFKC